jgi:hypothetical protein
MISLHLIIYIYYKITEYCLYNTVLTASFNNAYHVFYKYIQLYLKQ